MLSYTFINSHSQMSDSWPDIPLVYIGVSQFIIKKNSVSED